MALIERLMGLEEPPVSEHRMFALMSEYARGKITLVEAETQLEIVGDAPSIAELTSIYAYVNAGANVGEKMDRAKELEYVFHLARWGMPKYATAALVRTRLGL